MILSSKTRNHSTILINTNEIPNFKTQKIVPIHIRFSRIFSGLINRRKIYDEFYKVKNIKAKTSLTFCKRL